MSKLTFLNPPGLYNPSANGYAHVAIASRFDSVVLISGQGGETESGELSGSFEVQCERALVNVQRALNGASIVESDIAKLTVLIVGHTEDRLNTYVKVQERVFGPAFAPACTLIPVPRLALDGMLVEVEATCFV
ncbi:MAG: RidA family protein [Henriciella sp.]